MPPSMEAELEPVIRLLAEKQWPWRLHATYDETISRALDVFERVNQKIPLAGLNWFLTGGSFPPICLPGYAGTMLPVSLLISNNKAIPRLVWPAWGFLNRLN